MCRWYQQEDKNSDVILSSRVRLARNLTSYPFSPKISNEQAEKLVKEVAEVREDLKETDRKYVFFQINKMEDMDKQAMMERHVISPLLAAKKQETGLLLSEDESIAIMINEEDHIRIQVLEGSMNMEKAFQRANKIDDIIYEKLGFAFDEKLGYLTACPTNAGTGLRASYMVFLPALRAASKINLLSEEVSKFGLTLRGMYGEGSESAASIYQISNQKTLGNTEEDMITNLNQIIEQVMNQERRYREFLLKQSYDVIEDQVYRSYGVLKYAKKINTKDAMILLSQLKLGIDMGILKVKNPFHVYEMIMKIQPASFRYQSGKNSGAVTRERLMGEYLNQNLPELL